MNENMKYGLFFLGGLALGAIGAVAVSKGKLDLKPMAADLLSRGMDVKDAVLAKVETVKENMDGMVAEARLFSKTQSDYHRVVARRTGDRSSSQERRPHLRPPCGGTAPGSEGRGLVLRCSPRAFSRCFR